VRSGKKALPTKDDELQSLNKTPKKDKVKETLENRNITPYAICQSDVLYMPDNKAFGPTSIGHDVWPCVRVCVHAYS
jgi:hypothetical protein